MKSKWAAKASVTADGNKITARVFLVEISLLFLEITGHLLVTYMQTISDCSIREYRSIVAMA